MTREEAINQLNLMEMFCQTPKSAEAVKIATAALREQEERRWIPVTKMLPKAGEDVLVVVHDGYDSWVDTDEAMGDGRWLYFRKDRYVTHWMPLPEPPKEVPADGE